MTNSKGQNPDAAADGDFMSEAKDWAGELISGQTGTGRILVSKLLKYAYLGHFLKLLINFFC